MPTLSSSNRSQLAIKLEGTYPANFGVPQAGNGKLVGFLSETLDYAIDNVESKHLREDRQVPDIVQVSAKSAGGFACEHVYRDCDAFIQGVLQGDYTVYGTDGVSAAIATLTPAADTLTAGIAPAGIDAFTTLQANQWFTIIPDAGATTAVKNYLKGRAFRLDPAVPPTATVLNLDPSTQINTAILSGALTNAKISTSRATNGNVMKSYTLEVGHADVAQFRQYTGMIVSKMERKLGVGAIVDGSFDFMGKSFNLLQATSMGTATAAATYTPANATRGVFDMFEGGSAISITTYIKSADFSIDNNLRSQDAVGLFSAAGIGAGTMKIMGKVEVYFADQTMYNKFIDGSASSMSIPVLDIDGNGYVYYFPRIKYKVAKINAGGQDQDNMLAMDFQGLPDITVGSPTLAKSVVIYRVGVAA